MKRAAKTIECFSDIRKYLYEHKVPCLQFIRDGKVEVLYTQMYIDEKDKEIERLNNIINELSKENEQLKANWDKLKEWLENNWIESQDIWFVKIINKMQEIEQGSDKE